MFSVCSKKKKRRADNMLDVLSSSSIYKLWIPLKTGKSGEKREKISKPSYIHVLDVDGQTLGQARTLKLH